MSGVARTILMVVIATVLLVAFVVVTLAAAIVLFLVWVMHAVTVRSARDG